MTRTLVLWSLSCYEHPHFAGGGMVARTARAASSHRRWRGPPEVRQFEAGKSRQHVRFLQKRPKGQNRRLRVLNSKNDVVG